MTRKLCSSRHIAKNIVAAGLASRCEVQLAYVIGVARPVSIAVNTFGTGKVGEEELLKAVKAIWDLRPAAIIRDLGLRRPIYRQVACYGHFSRPELKLPWKRTNRVAFSRWGPTPLFWAESRNRPQKGEIALAGNKSRNWISRMAGATRW